jgi:pimeloyl-ACP methyl ester carboxylesterase
MPKGMRLEECGSSSAIGTRREEPRLLVAKTTAPGAEMRSPILKSILWSSVVALGGCNTSDSLPAATTGTADVNGTTLYYEVAGEGHPVVLLHGGNLDLRMWDMQFAEFSRNYRVIRYDVRGFGRSAMAEGPYQSHEDLRALLDHLAVEQAHLVGLSLGGRIAIDFALEYPERVSALVLAGPGLSGFEFSASEWWGPIGDAIQAGDSVRAAELWLESPYMAPAMEQPELAARLRTLAVENSSMWLRENTEVPLSPPAMGRIAELSAPTLLILGRLDVPDIHQIAELLSTGISGAWGVVIQGAGHMVNMERPEQFNRVVLEFFSEM